MTSVTLKKVTRLWKTQGAAGTVRRTLNQLRGYVGARQAMRSRPTFADVPQLLDYSFDAHRACLRPLQIRAEIQQLLQLLHSHQPRRILEIGTANGGTLFLFSRIAAPDCHLISLDLPGGEFGEGYPVWKMPLYRSFALPGQRIDLLRADSHDTSIPPRIQQLLGENEKLDFLFIDGDHTYAGVKSDFDMYSPLVRPGGIVAFHDIAQHKSDDCQVTDYWNELKKSHPHQEFIDDGRRGWGGIGVLFL